MARVRAALPLLIAIVTTWWFTATSAAQPGTPNGVFVQDSRGFIWLVLDGKRVNVGVWPASDEEIAAIPRSDRWAIMNDAGMIVAGDPPTWLVPGGDAPMSGQHPPATSSTAQPQAPEPVPTAPSVAAERFSDTVGRQVTDITPLSNQQVRITIREVAVLAVLPEAPGRFGRFEPAIRAQGKFVVVLADVENIGNQSTTLPPPVKLRDARNRLFTGDRSPADDTVKQAMRTVYPMEPYRGDLQPNLPIRHVFVFDVPLDATNPFTLARGRDER